MTMQCPECGLGFVPHRPWQKFCSHACREKARRKRDASRWYRDTGDAARDASACPAGAVELKEMPLARSLLPVAQSCMRAGFPADILESRDDDGLPIFFTAEGERLFRIWGPNRLSEIELRIMKLTPTDRTFPGGKFYLSEEP
jgi:hypothetical protein